MTPLAAPAIAEAPDITSIYPAGGQRGTKFQAAATGSFPQWPVDVWVDRPGLSMSAAKEKGQFEISIPPDAAAGIYWLRAVAPGGASALRPFVVGTLAEYSESEPNDRYLEPEAVESPVVVNGKLGQNDDVDCFEVTLEKGQTLVAALQANHGLAAPMDAVLQICDPQGFVLAQNNDARGLDPLLVFTASARGSYVIRTFAFPAQPSSSIRFAGGYDYVYRLTLSTGPVIDHAFPLALSGDATQPVTLFGWNLPADFPNGVLGPKVNARHSVYSATAGGAAFVEIVQPPVIGEPADSDAEPVANIEWPVVVCGRIAKPREVDKYRFTSQKGQQIEFQVKSRSLGLPLDPVLEIRDGDGTVLKEIDDVSKQADPSYRLKVSSDGAYEVGIRDLHRRGGMRFAYLLSIEESQPGFNLTLGKDAFVLTPDNPVDVPVDVIRINDLAEDIVITAIGLPDGVTAESVTSVAKGDSAKKVTLKLVAKSATASGSFRIVGRSAGDNPSEQTARFNTVDADRRHTALWLSIAEPTKEKPAAK